MPITAIAVDPGITTGTAVGDIIEDQKDNNGVIIYPGQAKLSCLELWNYLQQVKPQHIICESFEFRQNKQKDGLELESRNLIGVIQLYEEMQNANSGGIRNVKLHMQTAAKGKGYFDNPHLKEAGVYVVGKEHARDAVRHLMQWLTFEAGFQYNVKNFSLAVDP